MSRRSAKRGGGGRLGLGPERGAGKTSEVNFSMLGTATLVKEQVERRGWGVGKDTFLQIFSCAFITGAGWWVKSSDSSNFCGYEQHIPASAPLQSTVFSKEKPVGNGCSCHILIVCVDIFAAFAVN